MYQLSIIPYYNNLYKYYQNIIVINEKPKGPLSQYTERIKINDISPFKVNNTNTQTCYYAIKNFNNCNGLLTNENTIDLISFLNNNNYIIDYQTTKLLQKTSNYDSQELLFLFYYK